jgi:hypothetical protein
MNKARPSSSEVARWVAEYLCACPRAADTATGILRWWIAPRHGEVGLDLVEHALRQLEVEGVVSSHRIGSQLIFRRGRC